MILCVCRSSTLAVFMSLGRFFFLTSLFVGSFRREIPAGCDLRPAPSVAVYWTSSYFHPLLHPLTTSHLPHVLTSSPVEAPRAVPFGPFPSLKVRAPKIFFLPVRIQSPFRNFSPDDILIGAPMTPWGCGLGFTVCFTIGQFDLAADFSFLI